MYLSYSSGGFCPSEPAPAVEVRFVDSAGGAAVAVRATGLLRESRGGTYTMTAHGPRAPSADRAYALAGAFGRTGVFDVAVTLADGGVVRWAGIQVTADACGPATVVLQAPVSPD